MLTRWLAALGIVLTLAVIPARAAPDYPAFTGLVVDDAHVLSPDDRVALTRKLEDLQQKTGVQFAVATVPSLGGLEIEPYANALFREWGVGQKGANNGLLLILAPHERKLRFEVGYGLEGAMTDVQSKLILHNSMVPRLKANDPAGALKAGVDDAIAVLTGKDAALPQRQPQEANNTGLILFFAIFIGVIVFIVVVFVLIVRRARQSGGWTPSSGSGWVAAPSSDSSMFGGGTDTSSSSGSDSFSGGGGGDSGGGGSSDSY